MDFLGFVMFVPVVQVGQFWLLIKGQERQDLLENGVQRRVFEEFFGIILVFGGARGDMGLVVGVVLDQISGINQEDSQNLE